MVRRGRSEERRALLGPPRALLGERTCAITSGSAEVSIIAIMPGVPPFIVAVRFAFSLKIVISPIMLPAGRETLPPVGSNTLTEPESTIPNHVPGSPRWTSVWPSSKRSTEKKRTSSGISVLENT